MKLLRKAVFFCLIGSTLLLTSSCADDNLAKGLLSKDMAKLLVVGASAGAGALIGSKLADSSNKNVGILTGGLLGGGLGYLLVNGGILGGGNSNVTR